MLLSIGAVCCPPGDAQAEMRQTKHEQFLEEAKQAGAYRPQPKEEEKPDAVPTTPQEKREAILTPQYYTNWLGASFFTISTIEKELEVTPVRIVGLTFFYDMGKCFVGMEAIENGVVVQMTLRLYGEMATDFIQEAVDYGYEYVAKGKDVNVRSNTGKLLPDVYDTSVKRYRKTTNNGNVYMEVSTSGRFANEYEISIYRAK